MAGERMAMFTRNLWEGLMKSGLQFIRDKYHHRGMGMMVI